MILLEWHRLNFLLIFEIYSLYYIGMVHRAGLPRDGTGTNSTQPGWSIKTMVNLSLGLPVTVSLLLSLPFLLLVRFSHHVRTVRQAACPLSNTVVYSDLGSSTLQGAARLRLDRPESTAGSS